MFDVIQISYDEPNYQVNFSSLKNIFPSALQLHGIKGFDEAHRCAANISKQDWIFVVDGDAVVTPEFGDELLDFENKILPNLDPQIVLSWAAKNSVNGLIYGNGGIKLWPKQLLMSVDAHETGQTDWIGSVNYQQMNDWFNYTVINCSPYQAWRSGIREATKFCLVNDNPVKHPKREIWHQNLSRLLIWCAVGVDQPNGEYAILGARMGAWLTMCGDWDHKTIVNYDELKKVWSQFDFIQRGEFQNYQNQITANLRRYFDLPIADLDAYQSRWAKSIYQNPSREGLLAAWRSKEIT